jgi:hypothetical protein
MSSWLQHLISVKIIENNKEKILDKFYCPLKQKDKNSCTVCSSQVCSEAFPEFANFTKAVEDIRP